DRDGGVGDALGEQRQHDEAGNDEGAVADAVDLLHARADRRPEDDEIERGGDDRREQALQDGAAGARHLGKIDRADGGEVHCGLTRLTKISSSELWLVSRSRKRMPASFSAWRSAVMPVRSPRVS